LWRAVPGVVDFASRCDFCAPIQLSTVDLLGFLGVTRLLSVVITPSVTATDVLLDALMRGAKSQLVPVHQHAFRSDGTKSRRDELGRYLGYRKSIWLS